jgi:Domain of Unknown Function (DUF928)
MIINSSWLNLKKIGLSFSLGVALIPSVSPVVLAQNLHRETSKPIKISQLFKAPKVGQPPSTSGGGTRSGSICTQNDQRPIAVTLQNIMPLTVTDEPTLLVYVPKNTALKSEFVLKNDLEDDVYRTQDIKLPKNGGLVKIKLPKTVTQDRQILNTLEEGKTYHWYFGLVCKTDRREDVLVQGFLQKVQPNNDLQNIQKLSDQQQVLTFANNGIWTDAVSTLAYLLDKPNNSQNQKEIEKIWSQLIKDSKDDNLQPLANVKLTATNAEPSTKVNEQPKVETPKFKPIIRRVKPTNRTIPSNP